MFESKYFFSSNVRTSDGAVSAQMLAYNTAKEAEIKFHDEVSYGLKLDTIQLAHYTVTNEYGVVYENLTKTIDNLPVVSDVLPLTGD